MTIPVTTSSCWSNSETPVDSGRFRPTVAAAVPKTSVPGYRLTAAVRPSDVSWSPQTVRRHRRTDCRLSEELWPPQLQPSRWSSPGASRVRYQPKSFFTRVAGGAAAICGSVATLRRSSRGVTMIADNTTRSLGPYTTAMTVMHFSSTYALRSDDVSSLRPNADRQIYICNRSSKTLHERIYGQSAATARTVGMNEVAADRA